MKKLRARLTAQNACIVCIAILHFLTVASASASDTRIVPREVYIAPFATEQGSGTESTAADEHNAFLPVLSELVFLQASVAEPLLRSNTPEQADSVIGTTMSAEPHEVSLVLLHGSEEVTRVTRPLPPAGLTFAEVQALVNEATTAFVPHLGPVERSLAEAEIVQRSRREEVDQILLLEDRLESRFLLTLWATEIRAVRYDQAKANGPYTEQTEIVFSPFPLVAELTYFRSQSFGLLTRFSIDLNSSTPFYQWRRATAEGESAESAWDLTDNLILLPGVGISYRSLGRVGIDLSFIYSLGAARVTARKDVSLYEWYDQQERPDDFLAEGESVWFLYQMLTFQPGLTVALNDRWALRAATSFSFDPRAIAEDTPYNDTAGLAFRYLQLGLARRF